MTKKRIVIKNGEICGFADEVSFRGLSLQEYSKRRVSRIVPTNNLLLSAFLICRLFCHDESKVAAWTRRWACRWTVIIDGRSFGPFDSRADAIAFEKDEIYSQGKFFGESTA